MASRPATDPRFAEIDASLAVTLRFPGDRLAQFFCSFGSAETETIRIVGSKAELILDPAFKFDSVLQMTIRRPGSEQRQTFRQVDHFAGQIAYFSDCIAQGTAPEADGEEGLADMRALLAIEEAARTGETVRLEPKEFGRGLDAEMARHFPVTDRRMLT